MVCVELLNEKGEKIKEIEIDAKIFDAPRREHLIYEAVKMEMACRRRGTASTKTRAEVRGGGRKPWRQKGTGRARQGSIRAPHWVGGGVVFGPKPKDYSYKIPKKAKKEALKSALTAKLKSNEIIFLEDIELKDHKTKTAIVFLENLGLKGKKVLFLVDEIDFNLDKATRNIKEVKVLKTEGLNVYDLLNHEMVVCTSKALDKIQEVLA